jgi:hypothetical protein
MGTSIEVNHPMRPTPKPPLVTVLVSERGRRDRARKCLKPRPTPFPRAVHFYTPPELLPAVTQELTTTP